MTQIIPLPDAPVSLDTLAIGLQAHVLASGVHLPEDKNLLARIASAARYGSVKAILAVQDEQAVGIAAWWISDNVAHIKLLYALPGVPATISRDLLAHAMDNLRPGPALSNIYAELPEVPPPLHEVLSEAGFVGVRRLMMQIKLAATAWQAIPPPGYHLTTWKDIHLAEAAEVVYRANVGTTDAQIIPELRTAESTYDILGQTLAGRYGRLDRDASGLIFTDDNAVVGVTFATQRGDNLGFVAEICVLPTHRRRGLARALMHHTHSVFRAAGVNTIMLGVTEGNPAQQLYEGLGYTIIGSVWSYIWPKPSGW
jgi:ribosomal protein S18 acetylase RimI-like enzyme